MLAASERRTVSNYKLRASGFDQHINQYLVTRKIMKKLYFAIGVGIVAAGTLANTAQATSLIYDSFNGSSIDPATWTAVTPWANS